MPAHRSCPPPPSNTSTTWGGFTFKILKKFWNNAIKYLNVTPCRLGILSRTKFTTLPLTSGTLYRKTSPSKDAPLANKKHTTHAGLPSRHRGDELYQPTAGMCFGVGPLANEDASASCSIQGWRVAVPLNLLIVVVCNVWWTTPHSCPGTMGRGHRPPTPNVSHLKPSQLPPTPESALSPLVCCRSDPVWVPVSGRQHATEEVHRPLPLKLVVLLRPCRGG